MLEVFGIEIGTISQALSAVFSGGIFAAILTFLVRWRRLSIDAEQMLRTHFGEELERLSNAAIESDRRHEECEDAKRGLRAELDEMHEEMRGLKRQISQYSADKLIILEERGCPSDKAPHSVESARRVRGMTGEGGK